MYGTIPNPPPRKNGAGRTERENPAGPSPLSLALKIIIAFHAFSVPLWLFGQTFSIWQYDMVASTGLQPPRDVSDNAVVENNRAIAMADSVVLIPLHAMAAVGLLQRQFYGVITAWMAFALSMYWPAIFWMSLIAYQQGGVQHEAPDAESLIVTAVVFVFAAWGSWYLCRSKEMLIWHEKEFS